MKFLEKFVLVAGLILIFSLFAATLYILQIRTSVKIVTCAKDVKVCSDGSYVKRIAPFCNFALCPEI